MATRCTTDGLSCPCVQTTNFLLQRVRSSQIGVKRFAGGSDVVVLRQGRSQEGSSRFRIERIHSNPRCYRQDGNGGGSESSSSGSREKIVSTGEMYPNSKAHERGDLKVSDLHTLYYEVHGNPKGKPVVFLHGGPGAGCTERHARFFDPQHYRIVLFDQRGCGKSTPRGCLEGNTTWDLVEDIEKLREHLGVTKWMVMGGSWGVTLALAYAQKHPEAVAAMILRGVCMLRQQELDWLYKQGVNLLFPFAWGQLMTVLDESEREDAVSAFYKRLTSDDYTVAQSAAQEWLRWEMGLSFFSTSQTNVLAWDGKQYAYVPLATEVESQSEKVATASQNAASPHSSPSTASTFVSSTVAQARLECHYVVNKGFLKENQLLEGVAQMRHIPGTIVQGRYDFVCPVSNAYDLHRSWPEAELRVVPNAGHSMYESGIIKELVRATDQFKRLDY
ncbi:proline iminopeptidase [Marchantia polymorpha subsp. ruderalis]|uniref:Proline iminopeptidase n=2 Tax=Marchantia polymorpha TaxID=3197 RepID=A0AAF6B299_MARPO|nr:hypothetical protein MARPO_0142s0028 [Marchantia polymorpha]BBN06133.1 hypothetical protein Mp_3g18660 [Marchantia polymorpha subsp. ruderalis]|eukprot:PTQ29400.1 hypothetical protein MARPO_0142s0028 [Marchantia polymorpha]